MDIRGDECNRVHNQIDVYSKAFRPTMGCALPRSNSTPSDGRLLRLRRLPAEFRYHLKDVADPVAQTVPTKLAKLRAENETRLVTEYAAAVKTRVSRVVLPVAAKILNEIPTGEDAPKPADYIASHPAVKAGAEAAKLIFDLRLVAYLDKAGSAADPFTASSGGARPVARRCDGRNA